MGLLFDDDEEEFEDMMDDYFIMDEIEWEIARKPAFPRDLPLR